MAKSYILFQKLESHGNFFSNVNERASSAILKFYVTFDDIGETPRDRKKYRDCFLLYFVQDDTIKVYEPVKKNAGFDQGCIVNRNRIPKPDGTYYNLGDLTIGTTVVLYGKSFKILDCDFFTRTFLKEMGFRVNSPEPKKEDPVYLDRLQEDRKLRNARKFKPKDSFKGVAFFKNFPKSLRFYCVYKRGPSHIEDERFVSLIYDLYDGKIKIIEESKLHGSDKSGSDSYKVLNPTLVPKVFGNRYLGDIEGEKVLLNHSARTRMERLQESLKTGKVFGGPGTYLVDSNPTVTSLQPKEYYSEKDFDLGITIDVFGAKVFMYDCDEFTKNFYRYTYGKHLIPVELPEMKPLQTHSMVYPPNFGNQSDTLNSCLKVGALSSRKDLLDLYKTTSNMPHKSQSRQTMKFFLNCRLGCDGKTLRFLARFLTDDFVKRLCLYILAYFLEDDTMEITEFNPDFTSVTRSGHKILGRCKLVKPTNRPLNSDCCFYTTADLHIGNIICVKTRGLYLFMADDYTLEYMEQHPETFPHSNVHGICEKFRKILQNKSEILKSAFEKEDCGTPGFVEYDKFRSIIREQIPEEIIKKMPEQVLITFARYFAEEKYIGLRIEDLLSRTQLELRRSCFQEFEKLTNQFEVFDFTYGNRKRLIPTNDVYKVLVSCPINVNRDLIKFLILKFPKVEGKIDYKKLVECLDYINNPCKLPDNMPSAININWSEVEIVKNLEFISYKQFLSEMFGKEHFD